MTIFNEKYQRKWSQEKSNTSYGEAVGHVMQNYRPIIAEFFHRKSRQNAGQLFHVNVCFSGTPRGFPATA